MREGPARGVYDAVTTMDTVSLLRAGVRGLLAAAGPREQELRPLVRRDGRVLRPLEK